MSAKKTASTFMHPVSSDSGSKGDGASGERGAQGHAQAAGQVNAGGKRKGASGPTKSFYVLQPLQHNGEAYVVGEEVDLDSETAERLSTSGVVGAKETDESKAEVDRADYQAKREREAEQAARDETAMRADLARKAAEHPELRGHLGAAATLGSEVMFPEAHPGAAPFKYAGEPDEKSARKGK
jgi:hypothetical protein